MDNDDIVKKNFYWTVEQQVWVQIRYSGRKKKMDTYYHYYCLLTTHQKHVGLKRWYMVVPNSDKQKREKDKKKKA